MANAESKLDALATSRSFTRYEIKGEIKGDTKSGKRKTDFVSDEVVKQSSSHIAVYG